MANLSVTSVCNRQCSYCFAMETLDLTPQGERYMSWELFERSLQLLSRSGMREVRLLGGEPTLHPQFREMIDYALYLGFSLQLFSGGLIPPRVLEQLASVPADRLTVLLNVAVKGEDRDAEVARQPDVMDRLRDRIVLGLNIHSPSVQLEFLLDLIARYGLQRFVRLGLAHPIAEGHNRHLHPRHYPEVGRRVASFARRCVESDVRIEFDCGWVPCMFPEGTLEEFGWTPDEIGLRCSPIIDVLSNGEVISCYPLAGYQRIALPVDRDVRWLREQFHEGQKAMRPLMLYQKCAECSWHTRGECSGGCLAGSMRRQRRHEFVLNADTNDHTCDARRVSGTSSFIPLPILSGGEQ